MKYHVSLKVAILFLITVFIGLNLGFRIECLFLFGWLFEPVWDFMAELLGAFVTA